MAKKTEERLFQMKLEKVAYSSVVGSSLAIHADGVGMVALLMISIPQPHLDYKTVSEAVARALTTHGTEHGRITLVLPSDFATVATATADKQGR